MRNIYFVQANDVYKGNVNSTYIPYAAGCIIAHCQQNETIMLHYKLPQIQMIPKL